MLITRGPAPVSLTFDGADAVELTIRYASGHPTVSTRLVRGRWLASLPLTAARLVPRSALELHDRSGQTLYRRALSPPGYVEVPGGPGTHPTWVLLPQGYIQVRKVVLPLYANATQLVAYTGASAWITQGLKGGLL